MRSGKVGLLWLFSHVYLRHFEGRLSNVIDRHEPGHDERQDRGRVIDGLWCVVHDESVQAWLGDEEGKTISAYEFLVRTTDA